MEWVFEKDRVASIRIRCIDSRMKGVNWATDRGNAPWNTPGCPRLKSAGGVLGYEDCSAAHDRLPVEGKQFRPSGYLLEIHPITSSP